MIASGDKRKLGAVIGISAAAALIAFTAPREGVSLTPYSDTLAHNIATVCFGETKVDMRAYTMAECKSMLDESLADYAVAVRDATPGFDMLTMGQKIAAIDFAYNVGVGAYQGSTLRKRYAAKDFPGACDEYLKWRYVAGKDCFDPGNRCSGIASRRQAQRFVCRGEKP